MRDKGGSACDAQRLTDRPTLVHSPGYWGCVKGMLAREGIQGFYRGLAPAAAKTGIGACVQFLMYDWIKGGLGAAGVPSL